MNFFFNISKLLQEILYYNKVSQANQQTKFLWVFFFWNDVNVEWQHLVVPC